MIRITPTQLADETYQAGLARPMLKGPAGIMIPQPNAIYRKTLDGPLLTRIQKAAFGAYESQRLPPAAVERAAASLREDLIRRFPPTDMAVLERYGCAKPTVTAIVILNTATYDKPWYADLGKPVTVPETAWRFSADLGGTYPASDPPVPSEVLPVLETMLELARDRRGKFEASHAWVGRFRIKHGRFPFWREIGSSFPLIEKWLGEQRRYPDGSERIAKGGHCGRVVEAAP